MKNDLIKQANEFVENVCKKSWGMSNTEIKKYCLMVVKQNVAMAKLNKQYLKTAAAYAPFAGIAAEKIKKLLG